MRQAMEQWLRKHQMNFSIDLIQSLCDKLELDEEKKDGCRMLAIDLEQDRITEPEFTAGLSVLMGKKPEEVMEMVKNIKQPQVVQSVTVYHGTDNMEDAQAIVKTGIFRGEAGRDTFTDAIGTEPYFKYYLRLKINSKYIKEFEIPSAYSLAPGITKVYAPTMDTIPVEANMVEVIHDSKKD